MLILIIIFISMISARIVDSEHMEIAAFHSRGLSSIGILRLYILQTLILEIFAYILGILLGYMLCRIAGKVDGFLSFSARLEDIYVFNKSVFLYAAAGVVLSGILQLVPVFFTYKDNILSIKNKKLLKLNNPRWEKHFIDILLLIASVYMIYNYNKQLDSMRLNTLIGKSLDPMIFLSATVFMIAIGLLFLRILNYILKFIFSIVKKKLKPAGYAAFLQILRNRRKSDIISVFMIITIAASIFNSNIARTVNENLYDRIRYNVGTDLIYKEKWTLKLAGMIPPLSFRYEEPDYDIYNNLINEGYANSATRVIKDEKASAQIGNSKLDNVTLLAINTKEFGETAFLKSGLTEVHWYNYLNALALKTNGVIISQNIADYYSIGEGDTISLSRLCKFRKRLWYNAI